MELDSFTAKLMERTQARREFLNKKLSEVGASSRKRRTTLLEEQKIPLEGEGYAEEDDGSPSKRQCLDVSSDMEEENNEPKMAEDKENLHAGSSQDMTFAPFHAAGSARGLAALRKSKNSNKDDSGSCHSSSDDCRPEHEVVCCSESTNKFQSSKLPKSRLSALAADIRNWEDDTSATCSTRPFVSKSSSISTNSSTYASNTSDEHISSVDTQKDDFSNTAAPSNIASTGRVNKSHKRVNFDLSNSICSGDGCNSISEVIFDFSSVKPNCIKVNEEKCEAEKHQVRKVHVWDQAILTTLESQGFVKSQSQSKLSYEFSKCRKQSDEVAPFDTINEESSEISPTNDKCETIQTLTIQEKAAIFAPKTSSPMKVASFGQRQKTGQELVSTNISLIEKRKDPAELPLSARRELFEKAFCGGFPKPCENAVEENLTVAQRAAMFEVAARGNSLPATPKLMRKAQTKCIENSVSPVKSKGFANPQNIVKSNAFVEFNVTGKGTAGSPAKPPRSPATSNELTSPLKSGVGPHTRLIHQRLNVCNDWKSKEIACKTTEERKNEISALLNHWEKVSSSSSLESEPVSLISQEQTAMSMQGSLPEDDRNSCVFNDYEGDDNEESISFEEVPRESEQETEDNDSLFVEDRVDGFCRDESSLEDETKVCDITGEAVAVCNEMDEILNNALAQSEFEPLSSMLPLTQSTMSRTYSSASSTSSQYFMAEQPSSTPVSTSSCSEPVTLICENDSEKPLLHTVSFYRKQKQELKLTPVRSIVRREQIISPPSPERNETLNIQERIKELQEEVRFQQTVISQATQAVNFCHSTTEFLGSTEQIEGEKLLLISTQKRQTCLNEMQRLKTLGSKGQLIEEGTGTLTLDDIRLPLKREFVASQLEGKGNDTVHYFLCLFRFGAQIVFTQMLSTKDDISSGCLNFTNHITLQNLPADFSVAFEVYTLQTKVQVMSHDKKYHIRKEHSKLRLTPKGKKADSKLLATAVSSPGGPSAVRTSNFSVVGYTRITLQNCDRRIYTLEKVPFASPLEGIVQVNIQLHAEQNVAERGFLTMFEDVSGFGAWHRRWCVLDGSDLAFWKYPDDEKKKEPLCIIDLTHSITGHVRLVSRDVCARPHTFQLVTVRPQAKDDKNTLISRSANTVTTTKHLLSADTKDERILWCNKLNESLTNVRKWNPNALCPVEYSRQDK